MKIKVLNSVGVIKEMMWLAWCACNSPLGLDKSMRTKEEIWSMVELGEKRADADYILGRMMKLRLQWDNNSIIYPDNPPRSDYQAWCHKYPTYERLIKEAQFNLENELV